jgi:beta-galactosidase
MNANVPFEHLTARDLRSGLAPRYQAIYLPAHVSLPPDVLEAFLAYVRQGGRLVLDAPGAWFDDCGRVLDTGAGSTFESIFGVELRDFQYARNVPRRLHGTELPGFTMELAPTTARALERFDTGEAAVTEKRHAPAGSAVILAWEASRSVFGPDRPDLEALLLRYTLGTIAAPYACDGALVYRLAAPQADHYFFVNDGDARSVHLSTGSFSYARAEDPITGEALPLGGPIALSAHSGRWVRMEKA